MSGVIYKIEESVIMAVKDTVKLVEKIKGQVFKVAEEKEDNNLPQTPKRKRRRLRKTRKRRRKREKVCSFEYTRSKRMTRVGL